METILQSRRADGLSKIKCDKARIRDVISDSVVCDTISCDNLLRNIYQVIDENVITIGTSSAPETVISTVNIPDDLLNTVCLIIVELQLGGDIPVRALNISLDGIDDSKRVYNFADADVARTDYNIISTTVITTPTTDTLSLVGYCNTYEVNKTDVFWKIIPLFGATTKTLTLV